MTIEIFDSHNDDLMHTTTLDDAQLLPYVYGTDGDDAQDSATVTFPPDNGCYYAKLTYGQADHWTQAVSQSTGQVCIWLTCVIETATIVSGGDRAVTDDVDVISWPWDVTTTFNNYCYDVSVSVCFQATSGTETYCASLDELTNPAGDDYVNSYSNSYNTLQTGSFSYDVCKANLVVNDLTNGTTSYANIDNIDCSVRD